MDRAEKQKRINSKAEKLIGQGILPKKAFLDAKFDEDKAEQHGAGRTRAYKALRDRFSERLMKSLLSVYHPFDVIALTERAKDIQELISKIPQGKREKIFSRTPNSRGKYGNKKR